MPPAQLLGPPDQDADSVAITLGGESLRRGELWSAAGAVAERIAGASVVAVAATPTLETVIALVGAVLAAVPVVPVPADVGDRERAHLLADSAAQLWLGEARDGVDLPVLPVDRHASGSGSILESDASSTALIMYTSGTTGAPKGVVLSRRAIAADLDALADAWAWTPDDVLVHGLPLFHVHGLVLGLFGALRVGSPLIHTGRPRPELYADAARAGGTLFFGVPTVWSRLAADAGSATALSSARLLVSGSAPLTHRVGHDLNALTGQVPLERYGMTETLITLSGRVEKRSAIGSVGTVLAGVRSRLRGEDGRPVPQDGTSVGELQIRAATVFDGYLGRPDETAAAWTDDGWLRTGDAATVDPDGEHRIVGRLSVDLIKSGGYRIGAGEIENALLEHPSVQEAAVVGEPDADLGQRIVAYVVGEHVDAAALITYVAETLAVHKRPREVHVLDSLPRNEMGKVQKKRLLDG